VNGDFAAGTLSRHLLAGLRPEPLGSYLAGLGLMRLLGEQADPAATAAWEPSGLVIETTVANIAEWLADRYVPTPVLSPWNGGSGFGIKDREPKRRLEALLASQSSRLTGFREAIAVAEQVMQKARAVGWIKPDEKRGESVADKASIVQEYRNRCPEALLPWIDAAVVLAGDQAYFPPILGTGGNDGRLDFSTNFHERLLEVLDETAKRRARSLACARDLLTGAEAERLADGAIGQFDPALAGGQGSSPFGAASPLVNPWEYVLLVEGALLFASGTVRRHQYDAGRAARPFTVSFSPDGSESGAAGEESRGEVWVPAWSQPFTLAEIKQLFGEARASWRGRPAQQAVEFYAATRTLGVARGIDEFVRYGLQQRNGLAFVAVPLERVEVRSRPEVGLAARIEDWVARVRSPDASSAIGSATRRFDSAHLLYARDGGSLRLRDLLAAVTTLEQAVGRSGGRERAPVRTTPRAQDFLDEFMKKECAELRIAVGIASCATVAGTGASRAGASGPARAMRQLLLPVDPPDQSHPHGRWRETPMVPGFGLRPMRQVLADVLAWRSRTAADEPGVEVFRGVPTFRDGVQVPPADLHAFALGQLEDGELELWLRACLALSWRGVRYRWSVPGPGMLVPTLGLLHPLAEGLADTDDSSAPRMALGPDWAVRLTAGQVGPVHADAVRRLRQAGRDAVPALDAPRADGIFVAAALVPRCRGALALMERHFAIRIRTEMEDAGVGDKTEDTDAHEQETNPHELTEELS
jgi:CRISPR-associated protein Csx17